MMCECAMSRLRLTALLLLITLAGCAGEQTVVDPSGASPEVAKQEDAPKREAPAAADPQPTPARQVAEQSRKVAPVADDGDIDAATGRNIRYVTRDSMFLANEQWLLYACDLPAGQTDIGSKYNNDAYWYSRYNLGHLLMRSGMGIHMVHNPLFKKHAVEDKNKDGSMMFPKPKDFMKFKIRQFCARTGLPCRLDPKHKNNPKAFPPKGVFPIFLEFSSGLPRFTKPPQTSDFSTLRWHPDSMDRTINPGAVGMSLVKQTLWAEDFFATHREGPNGEVWFGNPKEYGNGFRGAVLTAMAITKMFTLMSTLAYDPRTGQLGGVNPKTYNPSEGLRYYPHQIRPRMKQMPGKPPAPTGWEVIDSNSHLFDLAALLWGTSEFYFYSDPKVKDSYDVIFGDQGDRRTRGAMFPLKPHMLSKGLSAVFIKNMMAMHFDKANGTFHSIARPGTKSGDIRTVDAGIALVGLANAYRRLHDAPPKLRGMIKMMVTAQAAFMRNNMMDGDGAFYNGYTIGTGPENSRRSLTAQGLGIRGLLAAYSVTKDASLKRAAFSTYRYLNENFWAAGAQTYRSSIGASISSYTPLNVGAMIGALRELALVSGGAGRREVVGRIDQFWAATQTRHRQQLAEIGPTGEPIPSMEQMRAMQARLLQLSQTDPERALAMKARMADVDQDGVPKPGMAGGKFGLAPVPAGLVKVKTGN